MNRYEPLVKGWPVTESAGKSRSCIERRPSPGSASRIESGSVNEPNVYSPGPQTRSVSGNENEKASYKSGDSCRMSDTLMALPKLAVLSMTA